MGFPKTLVEFQERFPDEESGWASLRRGRYQASVTAGTVLHRTRVPLRVWFLAMFFLGRHKKGISALQFQKDAGLGSLAVVPRATTAELTSLIRGAIDAREATVFTDAGRPIPHFPSKG